MKVIGFAGWSGSGKTTLVEQVIGLLEERGLVVSLIKHAHHEFEIDHPGKDSYRHRHAGCREVLITSANRWAIMHELRGRDELTLAEALAQLSPCDLSWSKVSSTSRSRKSKFTGRPSASRNSSRMTAMSLPWPATSRSLPPCHNST